MEEIVYNLVEIDLAIDFVLRKAKTNLFCLYGDLGAGKTTLIKSFLKGLGIMDSGSSPTFGLVHEYHGENGLLLAYHLDCYRLNDPEEGLDMGIEVYLDADCLVFVEWPERIESLLPQERTDLYLEVVDANKRRLTIYNR